MNQFDCVSIVKLHDRVQVPLGEKSVVIAEFLRTWPNCSFEDEDAEPVFGQFTVRDFTIDLTINSRACCHGATLESSPEGRYFDEELLEAVQRLCDANEWLPIFHDSGEDTYV